MDLFPLSPLSPDVARTLFFIIEARDSIWARELHQTFDLDQHNSAFDNVKTRQFLDGGVFVQILRGYIQQKKDGAWGDPVLFDEDGNTASVTPVA